LATLVGLVAGCSDGPRAEDDGPPGATSGASLTDTNGDATGDTTTTGSGTGDASTGPSADASTTGSPIDGCETIDCDGVCCAEGEECVLQACLPVCDTGVRCGDDLEVCCDAGDVCLGNACATPTGPCLDSFDCDEGEFCEPTLDPRSSGGQCLPQPERVTCEILPDFQDIELELEWSWEEEASITIPIVADVDGDDQPEIIVNTTLYDENGDGNGGGSGEGHITGIIVVFDGTTGEEQFRIVNTPQNCDPEDVCDVYGSYGRSTIGVADVDGNDLPDIIYTGRPLPTAGVFNQSYVHAYNGVGQSLWRSSEPIYVRHGAPAFANFDDDPESEIIFGAAIIDNDGTVVWNQDGDGGLFGSPAGYRGPIAVAADVTGDGYPEIISGRHAWSVNWQSGAGAPNVTLTELWDAGGEDGFPAVADFDQNGTPEVVLIAGGEVRILDGATGALWCGVDPDGSDCEGNDAARTQPVPFPEILKGVVEDRGGPPTVADFDADGRPEFSAAGAGGYVVFDINREGEDVVQPDGSLPPAPGEVYVRWFAATQDESSRSTGSSVFDFQGDGVAEVLYSDECFMRVFNGETGEIIAEEMNPSATIHEYPIVVDADGDGNSEILVVANDNNVEDRCGDFKDYVPRRGIFMYGDPNDAWVRTRRVWNSHSYHVSNSDARGLTPVEEENNWTQPGLNNYRQNVQGAGVFNAPDLAVDLQVDFENCLDETFDIQAIVRNEGALGIPSGVDVTLYAGTDNTAPEVGVRQTEVPLLPGQFTIVTWTVVAPGGDPLDFYVEVDTDEEGPVAECDESDNTGSTATVSCPPAG
jgi:hypothetical protein